MSTPENMLLIMSDEHTRKVIGCYGNSLVRTPNLDRLAAQGTLFTDGYTPSPICVPARASIASGHYIHKTRHWDNATPYEGSPRSWGHKLQENGYLVGSIGKLHYRNAWVSAGLDFQEMPLHVLDEVGDVLGSVRDPLPRRWVSRAMAKKIGPGETSYTAYDRNIADAAVKWIADRGNQSEHKKPWTLFVSFVAPHFPLIAPEEYYALYEVSGIIPEKPIPKSENTWMQEMRRCYVFDNFTKERARIALASYYGLVSFLDHNVGRVLDAVENAGFGDTTRIVYTSDHGDNIGERELWGKSNFYEESVGVPAIIAGPGIPEGHVCHTPINLTDLYPTIIQCAGLDDIDPIRPGRSLIRLANEPDDPERVIFSEYHAAGACSGAFMIRKGQWKLMYYVGLPPSLYDLKEDPEELYDLGTDPAFSTIRDELEAELRHICDPEEVDRQAKTDQAALVEKHGGREHVIERGSAGATPPPGAKPDFDTKD